MSEDDDLVAALAASVNDVLATECPMEAVLAKNDAGGIPDGALREQAAQLGWTGIAAPEAAGGSDLGFAALGVIYESLGFHLSSLPFIAQQLTIAALAESGGNDAVLEAIASGSEWPAVALPLNTQLRIENNAIHGTIDFALGSTNATRILIALPQASGDTIALVDMAGLHCERLAVHDHTRLLMKLRIDGAPLDKAITLATGPAAIRLQENLLDHAALAFAADAVGGAQNALARTVEYLKTRVQFGRPIGSFQALKHRAATMKVRLEGIRALLADAIARRAAGDRQASAFASLAKARACDVYLAIAGDCVQLHGGIGYTREYPMHLFLKRAKMNQLLFGDSAYHLDRAARLCLEAA